MTFTDFAVVGICFYALGVTNGAILVLVYFARKHLSRKAPPS